MQKIRTYRKPLDEFVETVGEIETALNELRNANADHYDLSGREL